jgi:putative transposase
MANFYFTAPAARSDRVVQYACNEFRDQLKGLPVVQSMSRKGNCWDNAVAESFFKTLKCEMINHVHFETRHQAKLATFEYIEGCGAARAV